MHSTKQGLRDRIRVLIRDWRESSAKYARAHSERLNRDECTSSMRSLNLSLVGPDVSSTMHCPVRSQAKLCPLVKAEHVYSEPHITHCSLYADSQGLHAWRTWNPNMICLTWRWRLGVQYGFCWVIVSVWQFKRHAKSVECCRVLPSDKIFVQCGLALIESGRSKSS